MADATVFVNDLLDEEITIDGHTFPWVHAISIQGKLNAARRVTIQFSTREGLEMCNIGSTLRIQVGKSDIAKGIDFVGKIKSVVPSYDISTATAFDYVADLNSSELFHVKDNDYAGMDLMQAAQAGLNNSIDNNIYDVDKSAQINLKSLISQCGVVYKPNQGFGGYQTRKAFLDKIFNQAYTPQPSTAFLGGAYPGLSYLRWYYAIRNNNVLDIFQPDIYTQTPVISLGRNSFNVIGKGLAASVDTARMVNSIVVTSDKTDFVATYSDTNSINQYGSQSLLVNVSTPDTSLMKELAFSVVNSNNRPAGAYTLKVENGHWIELGDVVEVSIPTLKDNQRFFVKEYATTITNTINTSITLGAGRITPNELIKRISSKG
jgi:hypothetical protein